MAEELGAWERVRGFRSKEVLLRTLLIHIAAECSLKETAVRAREADFADVSSVALFKRLKTSGEWLRWLASGVIEKWLAPSIRGLSSMDLPLKIIDGTGTWSQGDFMARSLRNKTSFNDMRRIQDYISK